MSEMTLKLDAGQIQDLIHAGLPTASRTGIEIVEIAVGTATIRIPFRDSMLRPGGVVSGPTLFAAADTAMYAAVLAHCGPELLAVTADTQIRFLRGAAPGDVHARAEIRKFGRRLIVLEIAIWTEDPAKPAALASGSYMRPA